MRSGLLITAAACAALSLSACNHNKRAGSQICTPFAEANAQPGDPASVLDDCLHRWGYTLAASPDSAEAVAQATVAACGTPLARWNQQGLSTGQGGPQPAAGAPEAPSLLTGQPTNPLAEHYTYAQGRALFYVVQARAGKCAPPPAAAAGRTGR